MDWWFDIDNMICRASVQLDFFKKPKISFESDLCVIFNERKFYRNGSTYVYQMGENSIVSINDVVFKGERFISLYVNRHLIKEYCVAAQKLSKMYMDNPAVYDKKTAFIKRMSFYSVMPALFFSLTASCALAFCGVLSGFTAACAFYLLFSGLVFILGIGVSIARHSYLRSQMARYAIISSLNKKRKKAKIVRLNRKRR